MSLAPLHRYIGRIIHLIRKEKGMRQSELALLTGLKQPNLSRIENGLVSPRQVTLEKIAKALGVEIGVFYSESKVQEVERKWAASLGPKHAALLLAGKLSPVPLLDTTHGHPLEVDAAGEPCGPLEVVLQLPPLGGEDHQRFGLRVLDDSMQHPDGGGFHPGDIAIFSTGSEPGNGDFAFILLGDGGLLRKVTWSNPGALRLVPLNPNHPERALPRAEVRGLWRLAQHLRTY